MLQTYVLYVYTVLDSGGHEGLGIAETKELARAGSPFASLKGRHTARTVGDRRNAAGESTAVKSSTTADNRRAGHSGATGRAQAGAGAGAPQ